MLGSPHPVSSVTREEMAAPLGGDLRRLAERQMVPAGVITVGAEKGRGLGHSHCYCHTVIYIISFKPIFQQNTKYLASGTFASPDAKNSTSASPNARIPTCWYILRFYPTRNLKVASGI